MGHGLKKSERLRKMERLYCQRGFTDQALAAELGVTRQTVFRDRIELEVELGITIEKDAEGRYRIHPSQYLSSIRVNLPETVQLYLAARRASQQTRSAQQSAASSLEKLALSLKQPMTQRLVKAASTILERRANPLIDKVFEAAARAWVDQSLLRIRYRGLDSDEAYPDVLAIYLIEPSPWSDSVYLIGHSDRLGKIVAYRLDRIEHVFVSGETYTLPDDYDEDELLRYAWGIWRSDKDPDTVRLRFRAGRAAKRLQESVWHPLETVTTLDNGDLLWAAPIAEPREMLPWVRSWGADVEVIKPDWLREHLMREIHRLTALYGISQPAEIPLYQRLWAKTSKDKTAVHPLICHLLDVAQVTLAMWQTVLPQALRSEFARHLDLDIDTAGRTIAFWAGLHDLGKASPGFQRKYKPAEKFLAEAGLTFAPLFTRESCYHATITTCTLAVLLQEEIGLPLMVGNEIAQALGGHHGNWPTPLQIRDTKSSQIGGADWQEIRRAIVQTLNTILRPGNVTQLGKDRTEINAFLTMFSGLVSVADWIGSMETAFPFVGIPLDAAGYAELALEQAHQALSKLHWVNHEVSGCRPFEDLFPFPPNDLQKAVIYLADQFTQPSLVIIEGPTGHGKTEAGLYLSAHWQYTLQQRGLYIAMPTMATSNQMYSRTREFLRKADIASVDPLLIHSQARWIQTEPPPPLQTEEEQAADRRNPSVQDMKWFLPRKRSLLAPFGVGTVDQALLSVLQTRHFFVRLFALGHKTIIFDEVHAYDTYMSHLFQRLLGWLKATNTSVILLSATLPNQTRQAFIQAYTGQPNLAQPEAVYPSITWASGEQVGTIPLPQATERVVSFQWLDRSEEQICTTLRTLLQDGGCAAVICNTVGRAQTIYCALKQAGFLTDDELILFHARTPFAWRDETERNVLARFGKKGERPFRSVVIATQVIEQSLDLDFDVMITDLAPVDLLLQRMGRLQRHRREHRPIRLKTPTLWVAVALDEVGVPQFGSDTFVYDEYILLRSYLMLADRSQITIPNDTAALIEAVYGDDDIDAGALAPQLDKAKEEMETKQREERLQASTRLVAPPEDQRLLKRGSADLEEDTPAIHEAFQALTRLGPPTVSLVCLHRVQDRIWTEPDGSGVEIDLMAEPGPAKTQALALHTVNISHQGVVHHLLRTQKPPTGWLDHPLLSNHYAAIFEEGIATIDGTKYQLNLSRELGLKITQPGSTKEE